MDNKELIVEAGFKVFGEKIVAGDFSSSGNATLCAQKLIDLVVAECVYICDLKGRSLQDARLVIDDFTEKNRLAEGESTAIAIAKIIKERFGV